MQKDSQAKIIWSRLHSVQVAVRINCNRDPGVYAELKRIEEEGGSQSGFIRELVREGWKAREKRLKREAKKSAK